MAAVAEYPFTNMFISKYDGKNMYKNIKKRETAKHCPFFYVHLHSNGTTTKDNLLK
jgi:hypothetical protein